MSIGAAVLYVVILLAASFVVSGVVPQVLEARRRYKRVEEFEITYKAFTEADAIEGPDDHGNTVTMEEFLGEPPSGADAAWRESVAAAHAEAAELRPWLVARRDQMQRDALAVGRGRHFVRPAGSTTYMEHQFFTDLFDIQEGATGGAPHRLDDLATITYETGHQLAQCKRDLLNPAAWVRLAFERVVRFPRYVLRQAGFSKTADSTGARIVTVIWAVAVGSATIGAFVLMLLGDT